MARSVTAIAHSMILSIAVLVSADGQFAAACGLSVPPPAVPALAPLPSSSRVGWAVPASIDATGRTDASAALSAWLAKVPDGTTVRFKSRGVYRLDTGLKLTRRRNLTLEGNGATLRSNGAASCGRNCTLIYLFRRNSGITIKNFNLVGNSPTPGRYDPAWEQAHGIAVTSSSDTEIENVRIKAVGGDGVYVSGWSDGVWFHDSRVVSNGRMGIAVTAGRNITVERVGFDRVGYGAFDIEPNDETGGASNVRFVDNTVGSITMPHPKGFFFGANGAIGSSVSDVTVSGNKVTGDALHTYVNVTPRRNIVFTNNEALVPGHGPILRFAYIDGLRISGIVQPLCSGQLASITDSREDP